MWAPIRMLTARRTARPRQREAEPPTQAERNRHEYVARFGPREVVGPDGVTVRLTARPSGWRLGVGDFSGVDDLVGCLLLIVGVLALLLVHAIVFRGRWTLRIKVAGQRKKIKVRLESQEAAAQRLQEIADRIRLQGLAALREADS